MSRQEAFRVIHFPESFPAEERARQRLAYDEFFVLQCIVALRRMSRATTHRQRSARTSAPGALSARWLASLPYQLTNAQQRVMGEIDTDLGHGPPMNRLLQGDVGAGKTFVAVYAMLRAVEAGEQAALMAPTQIPRRAARTESPPLARTARYSRRSLYGQHEGQGQEGRSIAGRRTRFVQAQTLGESDGFRRRRHACLTLRWLRR